MALLSSNVSDIVAFSIHLRTKCVFLVMFRPPLPPCPHLYALVLTPPPPLDAYVINGRPPTKTKTLVKRKAADMFENIYTESEEEANRETQSKTDPTG